jgi:hypothetical protein
VTEDRRGVRVKAEIDERHILGSTMVSMAERGELAGMSFGFVTGRRDNKITERGGKMYRSITGFKRLLDVSPTWNPAYEGATAELRSLSTLSAAALVPEQVHDGEPESAVDGPDTEQDAAEAQCDGACGEVTEDGHVLQSCEACTAKAADAATDADEAPEEQRSGAGEFDENSLAARKRRLRMMGLTLPH